MPNLISAKTIGDLNIVSLSIRIPSFRADSITPFINPNTVSLFRDGSKIREYPISITDTGLIKAFNDTLPIEGWYEYSLSLTDQAKYESARTPRSLVFGGKIESSYSEHFDADPLRAYYTSGRFSTSSVFAFSGSNALTESPSGQYVRNARDTFILMPVKTLPQTEHAMRFMHAALVDPTDSAVVELSHDWGNSWSPIGRYNSTMFAPWQDSITNTDDWKPEQILFTPQSDTTLFRLRFFSGASFQADGWWIDDISIGRSTDITEERQIGKSVFPLPAKEYVTITIPEAKELEWRLFDVMGNEIDKMSYSAEQRGFYLFLDVRNLNSCAYSLMLSSNGSMIGQYPILISR
jgi:hypothetical protein